MQHLNRAIYQDSNLFKGSKVKKKKQEFLKKITL